MAKVLDVERGDLVDYNGIGEENDCGGGNGGRQPPHCLLHWQVSTLETMSRTCWLPWVSVLEGPRKE